MLYIMSVIRVIVQVLIAVAGAAAVFVALPFMLRQPQHTPSAPTTPPQRLVWFDTPPPLPDEVMVETLYALPESLDVLPEETPTPESSMPPPPTAIDLSMLPLVSGIGVVVPVVPAIDLELISFEGNVGDGHGIRIDTPVRPLTPLMPVYPRNAANRGIEGSVIVEFTVGADGVPVDVIIVTATPPAIFEEASRHAIRRWRLSPALRDGTPVPVRLRQTIRFVRSSEK